MPDRENVKRRVKYVRDLRKHAEECGLEVDCDPHANAAQVRNLMSKIRAKKATGDKEQKDAIKAAKANALSVYSKRIHSQSDDHGVLIHIEMCSSEITSVMRRTIFELLIDSS